MKTGELLAESCGQRPFNHEGFVVTGREDVQLQPVDRAERTRNVRMERLGCALSITREPTEVVQQHPRAAGQSRLVPARSVEMPQHAVPDALPRCTLPSLPRCADRVAEG